MVSIIITAVVAGGIGFYGGMKYSNGKAASAAAARFSGIGGARSGQFGQGGTALAPRTGMRTAGIGGGASSGSILSMDDKSITLKLRDGGSKIVFFSATTQIQKTTEGSASDLSVGTEIMAIGSTNSDGSVIAQSIQIRPAAPVVTK